MALIGKIRNRSGLIVTFVGLGLLLFIIPVDKIWQQFMGFEQSGIGKFNGEDMLSYEPRNNPEGWKYNNYYEYQISNNSNIGTAEKPEMASLHFSTEDLIAQNVWENMIMDSIFSLEYNILGIGVSKEELNTGILSPNKPIKSSLYYQSLDENGNFNLENYSSIRNNILSNLNDPNAKKGLAGYEKSLKDSRKRFKYLSMIKWGAISTYQEAKRSYSEENTKATIKYLFKSYDEINDSLGNYNSSDLKNYFNTQGSKEKKWKQDQEVRSFDYVVLRVDPSEDDKEKALSSLASLKEEFSKETEDSMFVNKHSYDFEAIYRHPYNNQNLITDRSRGGEYSKTSYKSGRFSMEIDQQINSANQGDVIGPFISPENQNFALLVKVHKSGKQEEAKFRQIFIQSPAENIEKKKLADSLYNAVKRDTSKYASLVEKYSMDNSTKASRGIKNWLPSQELIEYNDNTTANVKHILIKSSKTDTATNQPIFYEDSLKFNKADSIMKIIKNDNSVFNEMAIAHSDAVGHVDDKSIETANSYIVKKDILLSFKKGGNPFTKGEQQSEFDNFSFNRPAGSIGIVKTPYGYHIIEVLEKNNPVKDFCFNNPEGEIAVIQSIKGYHIIEVLGRRKGDFKNLAIINKKLEPSEKTRKEFFAKNAEEFQKNALETSFEVAAENKGLEVKSAKNLKLSYPEFNKSNGQMIHYGAYGPMDLNRNNEIMEWAFNSSKVNSIKEPVLINSIEQYNNHNVEFKNTYVVAVLTEVIHEDNMTFNNIKPFIQSEVKNKNKAKSLSVSLKGVNSLEEASKLLNVTVTPDITTAYSSYTINKDPNYQYIPEPKVMATIFSMEDGETSALIEGKSGVYMIELISKEDPTYPNEPEEKKNLLLTKSSSNTENLRSIIDQQLQDALYKAYGVKDYRLKQKIAPRQENP